MTHFFYAHSSNLDKNTGYKQLIKPPPFARLVQFLPPPWSQRILLALQKWSHREAGAATPWARELQAALRPLLQAFGYSLKDSSRAQVPRGAMCGQHCVAV